MESSQCVAKSTPLVLNSLLVIVQSLNRNKSRASKSHPFNVQISTYVLNSKPFQVRYALLVMPQIKKETTHSATKSQPFKVEITLNIVNSKPRKATYSSNVTKSKALVPEHAPFSS